MYGSIESPSICFNPCIGRNSSGAAEPPPWRMALSWVSIRVLVGTAQELARVGIAFLGVLGFQSVYWSEQLRSWAILVRLAVGSSSFNPCIGRNSSGAAPGGPLAQWLSGFQSVYWSEQLRSIEI